VKPRFLANTELLLKISQNTLKNPPIQRNFCDISKPAPQKLINSIISANWRNIINIARSLKPHATKAACKALNKANNNKREEKRLHRRVLAQARAQKAKEILAIVETDSNNAVKAILGLSKQLSLYVGLAQPSAVQASLYRLHFGNPEISLVAYIFSPTGFHFHHFYLIIAWNAKT
jgi:hypothetical protein